jgi:crossover junction endodeoxyribonuclease RusA
VHVTTVDIPGFVVFAPGRPAPQGSKEKVGAGNMRESSPYLAKWRADVKKAVYLRFKALGIEPAALPLLRGPVGCDITFYLPDSRRVFGADGQRGTGPDDWRIDGPPDGDKLTRAVWDALTAARVWEDDGRVVEWGGRKLDADEVGQPPGALIRVWRVGINYDRGVERDE